MMSAHRDVVPSSNRRKRVILKAKKEVRRRKKLAKEGRLVRGIEIPRGTLAADVAQQAPNNSYSIKLFYKDVAFACVDCAATEVWTAEQQKWYYEVAKGPIYGVAVRCRACRNKRRAQKAIQRDQMLKARSADSECSS